MKKILSIAVLIMFVSLDSFAQKQSDHLPGYNERMDSIFRNMPKLNHPFVSPAPKGFVIPFNAFSKSPKTFNEFNPRAAVINKTSKGTIYKMPLDNMAVLVPDLNKVENMPNSNLDKNRTPENIPNPLYPGSVPKKKNK